VRLPVRVAVARHDVVALLAGDRDVPVLGLTVTSRSTDHQFLSRLKLSLGLVVRASIKLPVIRHLVASYSVDYYYYVIE
jgi:hypothetical protein